MTVLLDESVPRSLKTLLRGHEVRSVGELGWSGKKNGELLRLADSRFDAFITADQQLRFQQNLKTLKIRIVVHPTNRVPEVLKLGKAINEALQRVQPGDFLEVERSE